jgi:hypothetical protein
MGCFEGSSLQVTSDEDANELALHIATASLSCESSFCKFSERLTSCSPVYGFSALLHLGNRPPIGIW